MPTGYVASDFVHYFSRETLISLELTLDWAHEADDERTAVYVYRPVDDTYTSDEDENTPRFVVRLVPVPRAPAGTLERLAAAVLAAAKGSVELQSRGSLTIDGLPGLFSVFEHDGDDGHRIVRYQAFVQWDEVVFSFAGTCPAAQRAVFLPQFEAAVRSARVVPITEGGAR